MMKWPLGDWAQGHATHFTRIVDETAEESWSMDGPPGIGICATLDDGRIISLLFKDEQAKKDLYRVVMKMIALEFRKERTMLPPSRDNPQPYTNLDTFKKSF